MEIIKMERVGQVICPRTEWFHPIPRNEVPLKENEGVGSKIKTKCGYCNEEFEGVVEKVRENVVWE